MNMDLPLLPLVNSIFGLTNSLLFKSWYHHTTQLLTGHEIHYTEEIGEKVCRLTPEALILFSIYSKTMAQRIKCLPTMQETRIRSLGQEDPLEKEMATHSSTLAWKIPWTEKPGRLQSIASQSQT